LNDLISDEANAGSPSAATGGTSSVGAGGTSHGGVSSGGASSGGASIGGTSFAGATFGGTSFGGAGGVAVGGTSSAGTGGAAGGCPAGCPRGMICEASVCTCPLGTHHCDGDPASACASDTSLSTCGMACTPCAQPSHGKATCDGMACGAVCDAGYLACGAICIDSSSDPANCGACGHDCQGGGCSMGQCQPLALLTNQPHLGFLALYGSTLYVGVGGGGIATMALPNGSLTVLPPNTFDEGFAVNATTIFDATYVGNSVLAWPLNVSSSKVLVPMTNLPFGIAVDATRMYFTGFRGSVSSAPIAGGTPTTLYTDNISASSIATGIAVNATTIYVAIDGTITSMGLDGKNPKTLATVSGEPFGVAVDDSFVYWATLYGGNVAKMPLAGGAPTLLAQNLVYGVGIAVNDTSIYFSSNSTNDRGTVWRLAK
jgi:hypothetical protein